MGKRILYYLFVFCFIYLVSCQTKTESQKSKSFESDSINAERIFSNGNESDKSSIQDSLTSLPFNLDDWIDLGSLVDKGYEEDDGRYPEHYFANNELLEGLAKTLISKDTVLVGYYTLDNNRKSFDTYLLTLSREQAYGSYFKIVNVKNGKILSSFLIGGLPPNEGMKKMFYIDKDLKITLYDEKSKYNEKEDKRVILYKKVTNIYQIEDDGSIIKVE